MCGYLHACSDELRILRDKVYVPLVRTSIWLTETRLHIAGSMTSETERQKVPLNMVK